jgi:hypothetical protein
MTTTTTPLTAARAAALFVSDISAAARPTDTEVEEAIRHSVRTRGGARGCAADLAAAYGDHPELAAPRMRWARSTVEGLYQRPAATGEDRRTRTGRTRWQPAPRQQDLARAA